MRMRKGICMCICRLWRGGVVRARRCELPCAFGAVRRREQAWGRTGFTRFDEHDDVYEHLGRRATSNVCASCSSDYEQNEHYERMVGARFQGVYALNPLAISGLGPSARRTTSKRFVA
jgi:hypothetical protein